MSPGTDEAKPALPPLLSGALRPRQRTATTSARTASNPAATVTKNHGWPAEAICPYGRVSSTTTDGPPSSPTGTATNTCRSPAATSVRVPDSRMRASLLRRSRFWVPWRSCSSAKTMTASLFQTFTDSVASFTKTRRSMKDVRESLRASPIEPSRSSTMRREPIASAARSAELVASRSRSALARSAWLNAKYPAPASAMARTTSDTRCAPVRAPEFIAASLRCPTSRDPRSVRLSADVGSHVSPSPEEIRSGSEVATCLVPAGRLGGRRLDPGAGLAEARPLPAQRRKTEGARATVGVSGLVDGLADLQDVTGDADLRIAGRSAEDLTRRTRGRGDHPPGPTGAGPAPILEGQDVRVPVTGEVARLHPDAQDPLARRIDEREHDAPRGSLLEPLPQGEPVLRGEGILTEDVRDRDAVGDPGRRREREAVGQLGVGWHQRFVRERLGIQVLIDG